MFKVGDRVRDVTLDIPYCGVVADIDDDGDMSIHWNGQKYNSETTNYWPPSDFEIVEPSPVRTVTRKEIVDGIYGRVAVSVSHIDMLEIRRDDPDAADKLRKAAATLLEIAEAL